jgi:alpha-glucosidase (family GH31 glycosyl hydrolase)
MAAVGAPGEMSVSWVHVFTGKRYVGGKNYTVEAPLDSFPLFERVKATQ